MTTRRIVKRITHLSSRILPPALVRRGFQSELEKAPDVGEITVRLAVTLDERRQAFALLHDAYVGRGITDPSPSGMRFSAHSLMPGTATVVALRGERVIGTISLIEDTPLGIPMESTHPQEVAAVRATGRRFAEVSTLAVAREHRDRLVAMQLYNAMYRWAARHRGVEVLLLAVHPRIGSFFRHVLMCEQLGPTRSYDSLHGAASAPLLLDLTVVPRFYRARYDRPAATLRLHGEPTNLYRYFIADDAVHGVDIPVSSDHPGGITPNPPWTDDDLRTLLDAAGTGGGLTGPDSERSALAVTYPGLTGAAR